MNLINVQPLLQNRTAPLHGPDFAAAAGLYSIQDLVSVLSLCKSQIYKLANSDPTFPKAVRLGARCVRWKAADVSAWVEGL